VLVVDDDDNKNMVAKAVGGARRKMVRCCPAASTRYRRGRGQEGGAEVERGGQLTGWLRWCCSKRTMPVDADGRGGDVRRLRGDGRRGAGGADVGGWYSGGSCGRELSERFAGHWAGRDSEEAVSRATRMREVRRSARLE